MFLANYIVLRLAKIQSEVHFSLNKTVDYKDDRLASGAVEARHISMLRKPLSNKRVDTANQQSISYYIKIQRIKFINIIQQDYYADIGTIIVFFIERIRFGGSLIMKCSDSR